MVADGLPWGKKRSAFAVWMRLRAFTLFRSPLRCFEFISMWIVSWQ
jgi:hypothetical protein